MIPSEGLAGRLIPYSLLHPHQSSAGCDRVNLPSSREDHHGIVTSDYILLVTRYVGTVVVSIQNCQIRIKLMHIQTYRGACNFLEKSRAAQSSGALGIIVGDNVGHGGLGKYWSMSRNVIKDQKALPYHHVKSSHNVRIRGHK